MTPETTQTFQRLEFPEYAVERIRLRSFEDWPTVMKQKPEELADAGFFYTQISDRVICFSCGGGLRMWDDNDDPWEQHAIWYKKCNYLQLVKGPEFIAAVEKRFGIIQKRKNNNKKSNSTATSTQENGHSSCSDDNKDNNSLPQNTNDQNNDTKLDDTRSCRICYVDEYNTVFLPCGHILACAKCAATQTECPLCRKRFESINRIYFP